MQADTAVADKDGVRDTLSAPQAIRESKDSRVASFIIRGAKGLEPPWLSY